VGGPFSPSSSTYTLTNTGGQPLNWTAGNTQSWLTLSKSSGTLAAAGTDTVTVSVGSGADSLAAGSYGDTVTFTNTTNGTGNTTRPVGLTVTAPAALSVTPTTGLTSTGYMGGPFSASSASYTLNNTGGQPLNWTAGNTQSWLTLSKASGTLAAGGTDTVTVSVGTGANSLAYGSYGDTVTFTNTTDGTGNTTRPVALTIKIPGDVDGDGQVNLTDLLLLAQAFGSVPGDTNWNPACDFNGDGRVDVSDLLIMAKYWGT
jgi:hypothetical protein